MANDNHVKQEIIYSQMKIIENELTHVLPISNKSTPHQVISYLKQFNFQAVQTKLAEILQSEKVQYALAICRKNADMIECVQIENDKTPVVGKVFILTTFDANKLPVRFVMKYDYEHIIELNLNEFAAVAEQVKQTDMTYIDHLDELKEIVKEFADYLLGSNVSDPGNKKLRELEARILPWKNVIAINKDVAIEIKESSKIKETLSKDDVKSAELQISITDKFGLLKNISAKRTLTQFDFMSEYDEPFLKKFERINNAKNAQQAASLQKNISGFFARHPVASTLATGAAAVAVSVMALSKVMG